MSTTSNKEWLQVHNAAWLTQIAETEAEVREAITETLRARSLALHRATSDLPVEDIKFWRKTTLELDDLLLVNLTRLKDNAPQFPSTIAGGRLVLQWVKGDNACYVPHDKYDPAKFAYNPVSIATRLQKEMSHSQEVLIEIAALEHAELNPVEATEREAIEALTISILQQLKETVPPAEELL